MVLLLAKVGSRYLNDLGMRHRILLNLRYFFHFGLNSDCCYGCHDSWPGMPGMPGMPRRTVTPVMPVMSVTLIAASQAADVSKAAPWASALAARLAAVVAAALPFYHLRAETATEKKKMKKK